MKKAILAGLILLSILMISGCVKVPETTNTNDTNQPSPKIETNTETVLPPAETVEPQTESVEPTMTEAEAKTIAESTCIKGGEALSSGGTFNPNSKTWWFDANLNATQPGCSPACVVSEETKTAEINWRCTGLIAPEETLPQLPQAEPVNDAASIQ